MSTIDFNLLKKAINFFPDAAIIIDENYIIREANHLVKNLFGYQAYELVGQNFLMLIPNQYRSKHEYWAKKFMASSSIRQMGRGRPLWTKHKDGKEIEIDIALRTENTIEGKMVIVSIRDLSEIRGYEKEIISQNEHLQLINIELEKFAHIVSHDLKSPLKQVKALSDLLLMEFSDVQEENIVDILKHLSGSVASMEGLIQGILAYSELGKSKDLQQIEINLNEIIEEIRHLITIPDSFHLKCPKSLPIIKANPTKILQVMMNLITNAIKYNDKTQGILRITVIEKPRFYHFMFEDNGIRVEESQQEKIFALFVREYEQHKQRANSHGIGLATTKKIIQDQGGRIWYEESPLGGSAFHFTWYK